MPFKKGHDPNRNLAGRPKGSTKKLTRSELEELNNLLGKLSKEAIEVIVGVMRDPQAAPKDRVGAAKYVVSTKIQVDQIIERRDNGLDDDEEDVPVEAPVVNIVWEDKYE